MGSVGTLDWTLNFDSTSSTCGPAVDPIPDTGICPGDTLTCYASGFAYSPSGAAMTYAWDYWHVVTQPDETVWAGWDPVTGQATGCLTVTPASTTQYRMKVTANGKDAFSNPFTVQVGGPIRITNQQAGTIICPGQSVNLGQYVAAIGGQLQTTWQQQDANGNWFNISGSPVTPSTSTNYRAVFTSSCPPQTIYSLPVSIAVNPIPVFTQTPSSTAICPGQSSTFSATANTPGIFMWQSFDGADWVSVRTTPGVIPNPVGGYICNGVVPQLSVTATGQNLTYQWQSQSGSTWSNVSGATKKQYKPPAQNGTYRVIVSNSCGSVTSNPATLIVSTATPPSITTQPQSTSYCAGGSATLTVAASGSSPSYTWQSSTDQSTWYGAGTGTTSITVSPSVPTYYRVIVSTPAGR